MTFGLGSFDVADNGLMNMMLGPELSRPMVQSLHAFVAVGFTSGTKIYSELKLRLEKIADR